MYSNIYSTLTNTGILRTILRDDTKDIPIKLQNLIAGKTSLVTPGVTKEVNYALGIKKEVYEYCLGN